MPKKSCITDNYAGLEGVEGRRKPNRQVLISFVTIGMIARNNFYNYFKDRAVKKDSKYVSVGETFFAKVKLHNFQKQMFLSVSLYVQNFFVCYEITKSGLLMEYLWLETASTCSEANIKQN